MASFHKVLTSTLIKKQNSKSNKHLQLLDEYIINMIEAYYLIVS